MPDRRLRTGRLSPTEHGYSAQPGSKLALQRSRAQPPQRTHLPQGVSVIMVGSLTSRVVQICLLLAVTVAIAVAQRSRFDPAGSQPTKQHDGIMDFALKQINPGDKDYGECIAEARQMALNHSIETTLYWSNLVTLGRFAMSLFVLAYQVREQGRRERLVAAILCQYHNGWLRTRSAAIELSAKYNALVASVNAAAESQLRQPTQQATTPVAGAPRPPANGGSPAENPPSRAANSSVQTAVRAPRFLAPSGTPVQQVDLISSNNGR